MTYAFADVDETQLIVRDLYHAVQLNDFLNNLTSRTVSYCDVFTVVTTYTLLIG